MTWVRPVWVVAVLVLALDSARADPIFRLPDIGTGLVYEPEEDSDERGLFAFVGELNALAAVGVERKTTFPDIGDQEGGTAKFSLRLGFVGATSWPVDYWVRIDVSEARRIDIDRTVDAPMTAVSQFVDDAALWWRPAVAVGVIVGRFKVPFARSRHFDRMRLTAAAVPFVVDRMAPDRRWGATVLGEAGRLAYAAGAYLDRDDVEPRLGFGEDEDRVIIDPSLGGRAAFATHVEWASRSIGRGFLADDSHDPGFFRLRWSAGAGALVRIRGDDRRTRTDLSLSGNLKYQRLSAAMEALFAVEPKVLETGLAAEVGLMATDNGAFFVRGEYERCDERAGAADEPPPSPLGGKPPCREGHHGSDGRGDELWTLGFGATWFVTTDRRSKATFFGFLRRDFEGDLNGDGAVVQLQTAL